jgi:hypothetical protein
MNNMTDIKILHEIKYKYIIDLTKYFLSLYRDGEIKDLSRLVSIVKSNANCIAGMGFVFDESIWPPNRPEYYKNLVLFDMKLKGSGNVLIFRLMIDKGIDQEPMFFNSFYN